MPNFTSRKRGWSSTSASDPRCRPALNVMPSIPPSIAEARRTRRVSRGLPMVSFSMQLMKISPSPCLASMVRPTCNLVASANRLRSNCTTDLSRLATLYLYFFCFSFTKPVLKRRSETVGTMASEMCPMPPSRAATSESSAVEISTPMPPVMMGTNSFLPNINRKSSTRFIFYRKNSWYQARLTGLTELNKRSRSLKKNPDNFVWNKIGTGGARENPPNLDTVYSPVATGRFGSVIHSLQLPAYSFAPGRPACSIARIL